MRFMLIRKADKQTEEGLLPNDELLDAMMKYNEEMLKAGVMLQGVGLHPSSKGARVKITGAEPIVIDGPFIETKELIAGFSMIQVSSKEEAIEWARRWPKIEVGVEIELRQVFEPEDFGPAAEAAIRKQEASFQKP
jgi:hypothetical protein